MSEWDDLRAQLAALRAEQKVLAAQHEEIYEKAKAMGEQVAQLVLERDILLTMAAKLLAQREGRDVSLETLAQVVRERAILESVGRDPDKQN